MIKKAILLVGSPRGYKSTSISIGGYFMERLARCGVDAETLLLPPLVGSEAGIARLTERVIQNELVVLATPLYADSLPAPVIKALEEMAGMGDALKGRRFMLIVNCGFPESAQNAVAVAICRKFAERTGMIWAGALALGMGEVIAGKPLGKAGRMARGVVRALDMTAQSLSEGGNVPQEATEIMGRGLIPKWLYVMVGNLGWNLRARKHGVRDRMRDQPYA